MKTFIQLQNAHEIDLPEKFRQEDVRFPSTLAEYFIKSYTKDNDIVFDPFAGFGTTLQVAENINRQAYGIEYDEERVEYIKTFLNNTEHIIHGNAMKLLSYNLPRFDFSITSPPYMNKFDKENPLTSYKTNDGSYEKYLEDIQTIYKQMSNLMKNNATIILEVSNLKKDGVVTTLAWDIERAISDILHFKGEIIVGWDKYGYGYDHSYCLIFDKK